MADRYCIRKRRVGQWLRGGDWSGARCLMEQAAGPQPACQTVGEKVIGSRITDEMLWLSVFLCDGLMVRGGLFFLILSSLS